MTYLALGLMSGTSADGVDAALIRTDGENRIEFVAASTQPYSEEFRERLLRAAQVDVPFEELLNLERDLGRRHASAVTYLCQLAEITPDRIDVIGSHGHTIRHFSERRLTWQLGDISWLAEATGRTVVGDFRRRDMAAGGEGAPLVPLYHAALANDEVKPLVVLNLGGVANVTYLGTEGEVIAGDVGPGCGLLDAYCQRELGIPFDRDGNWGGSGTPQMPLVVDYLRRVFFLRKPFPKSADRFEFIEPEMAGLAPDDALATLAAITAGGVAMGLGRLPRTPTRILVCGGGVHNPLLMRELSRACMGLDVVSAATAGWRPDSLEAECFAWLAVRRLQGLPASLPSTTGCRQATVGGLIAAPSS